MLGQGPQREDSSEPTIMNAWKGSKQPHQYDIVRYRVVRNFLA